MVKIKGGNPGISATPSNLFNFFFIYDSIFIGFLFSYDFNI